MRITMEDYPVQIEIPVAWGEMDAFGHVNNAVYFRYAENVRIVHFNDFGIMELKESTGIGPIVAETSCRFRLPVTYPDILTVGSRVGEVGTDRFTILFAMWSQNHDRLAAHGETLIVTYDYRQGVKTPIPDELRTILLAEKEKK